MNNDKDQIKLQLQQSDIEIIRLLEDLIEILIIKGTLNYTDLPGAAMQKILLRKKLRDALNNVSPLIDDENQ